VCRRLLDLGVELVAIERPDGLLIERLLDAGLRVIAIHPNQRRAWRVRASVAGSVRLGKRPSQDRRPHRGCSAPIAAASSCPRAWPLRREAEAGSQVGGRLPRRAAIAFDDGAERGRTVGWLFVAVLTPAYSVYIVNIVHCWRRV